MMKVIETLFRWQRNASRFHSRNPFVEFTINGLMKKSRCTRSQVRESLQTLRAEGVIRFQGQVNGAKKFGRVIYDCRAIFDLVGDYGSEVDEMDPDYFAYLVDQPNYPKTEKIKWPEPEPLLSDPIAEGVYARWVDENNQQIEDEHSDWENEITHIDPVDGITCVWGLDHRFEVESSDPISDCLAWDDINQDEAEFQDRLRESQEEIGDGLDAMIWVANLPEEDRQASLAADREEYVAYWEGDGLTNWALEGGYIPIVSERQRKAIEEIRIRAEEFTIYQKEMDLLYPPPFPRHY